ncbi:MAG: GNAT family protein [Vicinamibacterales bacterium]
MAALEMTSPGLSSWRDQLPPLVNDQVTLRELQRSDVGRLYDMVRRPEVAHYTWPPPPTMDALEQFIEWTWSERANGKYVGFGIVPAHSTVAAGVFELRQLQPNFFRAELGFFIDPSLHGTGLFTSAASLLVGFARDVLGVHRIEARTSIDNVRGNAALRKLGARREGVLRAAFVREGRFVDQRLWAILTREFQDVPASRRMERATPIEGSR